jgi:hypothetical protein
LNKSTDKELQDVIQNYLEQEDLVKEDEKAIRSLESLSHRTKKQESDLNKRQLGIAFLNQPVKQHHTKCSRLITS